MLWRGCAATLPDGSKELRFRQNKTKRLHRIADDAELAALLPKQPDGNVKQLHVPLAARLDGGAYTYKGLNGMLRESIAAANERRRTHKAGPMKSFGFRDLKGKGATDMYYIQKLPFEDIQALCAHANKTTTETYVKQR